MTNHHKLLDNSLTFQEISIKPKEFERLDVIQAVCRNELPDGFLIKSVLREFNSQDNVAHASVS